MKSSNGFTLVELLLVLGIIGILCCMVIPAFSQFMPGARLDAASKVLAEDIRLARSCAITTQRKHGMVFDAAADSYYVYDSVITTKAQDPLTKKSLIRDYRSDGRFKGIDLVQVTFPGGTRVEFNSLGSPDGAGTVLLESNRTRKTVSVGAGSGRVKISGG